MATPRLSPNTVRSVLDALRDARVFVVGDVCLDAYWTIDRSRSEESLETSLQTRPVREQRYYAGGGANVAMNLKSLGIGHVVLFGVVGGDPFGDWLRTSLESAGVDVSGVLTQSSGWATQVFVKPHEGGSELARIDLGNWNELHDAVGREILERIEGVIPDADFVVINEQAARGIHTSPAFRERLLDLVRSHARGRAIIDSRHYIDEFAGVMRKLNVREAARVLGEPRVVPEYAGVDDMARMGRQLHDRWNSPIALTAGDRGSMAVTQDGVVHVEAVQLAGRLDPVGAGDAYLAGLAGGLVGNADFVTAVRLGTLAAAVTVRQLNRPGTATPEDILVLADRLCPPSVPPGVPT